MAKRLDSAETLMLYRKILVICSGIAMVLPCLLGMLKFWLLLPAVALALPAALWWRYPAARGITRTLEIVLIAAPLCLLLVLWLMGQFQTEYFSILLFSAIALPAASLAAMEDRLFDVRWMRIAAVIHAVETGLVIAYIFESGSWRDTLLTAATAFAVLILSLMIHPLFRRKTSSQEKEP